jgi:hypothetical protein
VAGDWIKMTCDLHEKPEVAQIGSALGMDECEVIGRLFRVWSWFSKQSVDGTIPRATPAMIDRLVAHEGFAEAMTAAHWLLVRNGSLALPNFDRHNSTTAKERAMDRDRKRRASTGIEPMPDNFPGHDRKCSSLCSDSDSSDGDRIADRFSRFWQLWPKRVAKADARKAFAKACAKVHPDELLAAVEEFAATPMGRSARYCPHPATWLNDERWTDDRTLWWAYETTPEEGRKARQKWRDGREAAAWWSGLTDGERAEWVRRNAEWFPKAHEFDGTARALWASVHQNQQWDKIATWAWREHRKGEAA